MVAPSLMALASNVLQLPALLVHTPDDLVLYAALALPFTFAGPVYNFWYLARRGLLPPLRMRPTLAGALPMLREAWPLALSQASILVMLNSGTLILGFTDGDEDVGQFASAYRLMLMATVITASLWNAYFPAFARSHDRPVEAAALSREYLGLLAWMGLPIMALGWALGRHVVELLYVPAFGAKRSVFRMVVPDHRTYLPELRPRRHTCAVGAQRPAVEDRGVRGAAQPDGERPGGAVLWSLRRGRGDAGGGTPDRVARPGSAAKAQALLASGSAGYCTTTPLLGRGRGRAGCAAGFAGSPVVGAVGRRGGSAGGVLIIFEGRALRVLWRTLRSRGNSVQ